MKIQLTEEVQAKLDQLFSETGRSKSDFVQDAMAGYFDELAQVRTMLDNRYEDVVSGRVTLVPGEQVAARLREKSEGRCRQTA